MSLIPYENSQQIVSVPNNSNNNNLISRMPQLVTAEGNIDKNFDKFYQSIVNSFEYKLSELYEYSDKVLNEEDFNANVKKIWLKELCKFYNAKPNERNFDIEIDIETFQSKFRNIIGKFNVMFYILDIDDEGGLNTYSKPKFYRYYTSLYFTYKNNKFMLISNFEPFIFEEI